MAAIGLNRPPRFPILVLLHPRERTRLVAGALAALLPVAALKWRDDLRRYGVVVMVLSILLATQGFHSIEHAVQEIQYYVLHWPPCGSSCAYCDTPCHTRMVYEHI